MLVALPLTAAADFTKNKVAVLDFQLQGDNFETKDMGSIVAEWFITALVKTGRFDVVERAMLKKILDEQKMGLSGVVDEKTATKLGKILGVKVIISGSVMKLQDIMEVNARIIDVETASIIAAESVRATASTSLQSLIVQISD
ncbi:MAG TPA: FlgO family outer membrane protein, partial [Desulfurivibrionaceae bacterium]|nr:FlgO family outer membrane protein [Desulfurivibrionaceae bacterium]